MSAYRWFLTAFVCVAVAVPVSAQEKSPVATFLDREIIGPRQSLLDTQEYLEPRIPRMPAVKSVAEWEKHAGKIRKDVLDHVVFRGEAANWRTAKTKVEWLDTIEGGSGYRIKKLRYEALPGLWIPALLYEPENLKGKLPVSLAVNGHDSNGKAADYKQMRCINMAKRGMVVLNVEWFNMGQLKGPGFNHYAMNQLDLCGTSGLAPFYLAMTHGLDILLSLPNADPERVAVSGLSGGGWQTIFVSSLDTRVTLCNPVAGYSSFLTRNHFTTDLGDSEQTPCDLAKYADYAHLTAMLAPRAALLTFNAKDDCCFAAGHALPPLMDAAKPIYKLYGKETLLRSHVNDDPGTHNYLRDNREALYRILGDVFFAGMKDYNPKEIDSKGEIKGANDLAVELPENNLDFNKIALLLAEKLPRNADLPVKDAVATWRKTQQQKLSEIVAAREFTVEAKKMGSDEKSGVKVTYWRLRLGGAWSVPVTELVKGEPKGTTILLNDAGRKTDAVDAERLLSAGQRVLALDLFFFGEAKIEKRDFLYALLMASTGGRPLGIQARELAAIATWSDAEHKSGPVSVVAVGPRMSMIALVAAGLDEKAIGRLELHGALGSLKEIIEKNRSVDQWPEMFCFGLLEAFDVKQLVALAAPRPVAVVQPSERARKELASLKKWYATLGKEFDPLAP
jgi:Acetyl xylan esterase (AXE1)